MKKEEEDRSGRKFDALYNGIIQKKISLVLIIYMTGNKNTIYLYSLDESMKNC